MQRTLILILALSLIFGVVTPQLAYAGATNEKVLENVILKLKELLDISNDYDGFVSRVNAYNDEMNFFLNWTDSKEILPDISIHTDSKGNIISYDTYLRGSSEPTLKLPSINKDEALKLALEFVEKIDPSIANEIQLVEITNPINTWDRNFSFRFIRNIDNIPYATNNIYVNVDMHTGDINNYYSSWDRNLQFPKANNIISLEEAKESYKDSLGLKLIYKTSYRNMRLADTGSESNYYLAYSHLGESKGIDAVTGKPINLNHYDVYRGQEKSMAIENGTESGPTITPQERQEIDKLSGIKDTKEAEKKAREILKLDSSYELKYHNLYSSWQNPDEFFYNLSFLEDDKDNHKNVEISLDAKTLDLLSFYKHRDVPNNAKARIKNQEALELAKNYIKQINPDKIEKIEYIENSVGDDQLYYYFNFIRKIDDIYVESDRISVGVDAVNKDISSYSISWYKGEFPSRESIISVEKAYEILFDKIGFGLSYMSIFNYDNADRDREIKLVYSVSQEKPNIIDAKTGEILDYTGNPYKENRIPTYIDIDNSYAKDKINTLSEYGIGFSNDKFNPKEKIRQKDFLYLLWKSFSPYRNETEGDIDVVYKELSRQNIVKDGEENPEGFVTKEEGVKFTIRAMKYERLAEIPDIYAEVFKDGSDISPNLKGYMTLAYGLKIINGDGSDFIRPKYELLREDAANIIFNYMFN